MKQISFLLTAVALLCGAGMANGQESERFKATKIKAEQGNALAQYVLGLMYYAGEGVPKDDVEAEKWFRKAAEQGYAKAQLLLSGMYLEGEGVPKNDIESYAWVLLAKANGIEESRKIISNFEKYLTAEQMEKGQARAAELHRLIEQKSAE